VLPKKRKRKLDLNQGLDEGKRSKKGKRKFNFRPLKKKYLARKGGGRLTAAIAKRGEKGARGLVFKKHTLTKQKEEERTSCHRPY